MKAIEGEGGIKMAGVTRKRKGGSGGGWRIQNQRQWQQEQEHGQEHGQGHGQGHG